MKRLCVLGATGSIGVSTLDVVARHPDRYRVTALTANSNDERLFEQCQQHKPEVAVMVDAEAADRLQQRLSDVGSSTKVLAGSEALQEVASMDSVDAVMAAIVGAAGLLPSLAAANTGKQILLANKEALVMSGQLFMDAVASNNATLLPIDSEHNAIFQCMPEAFSTGLNNVGVSRILLTASGGPFRNRAIDTLSDVTPDEACAHPNWDMGRKISVDSATMMNKGLEVIEACWLFHTDPSLIQVVIHPESVIHSMVQYVDGSVLAQMGNPDMRTPIAHAMAWPERIESGVAPLDLFEVAQLNFQAPDMERFACLRLAYEAAAKGGTAPSILNAANEIAVDAFLNERLSFTGISEVVEQCLHGLESSAADSLEVILADDARARDMATQLIEQGQA